MIEGQDNDPVGRYKGVLRLGFTIYFQNGDGGGEAVQVLLRQLTAIGSCGGGRGGADSLRKLRFFGLEDTDIHSGKSICKDFVRFANLGVVIFVVLCFLAGVQGGKQAEKGGADTRARRRFGRRRDGRALPLVANASNEDSSAARSLATGATASHADCLHFRHI